MEKSCHMDPPSTLVVPSQPLVVPVGSEVTLPCQLESVKDLRDLVVDWARHDLKPRYIHIRRDGWTFRLSDAGTYHCFIPQMNTRAEVTLHVGDVSCLRESDQRPLGSPELRCESRGWFPEPELVWLDSEGTVLTGARTEAQRGVNEETFSVSSRLSVEQSPGNSFTLAGAFKLNKHKETCSRIKEELHFMKNLRNCRRQRSFYKHLERN
uniref:Ig-like domain-containing protein n=1 Tax=Neogobius melanostomus TaxID=47308 RepID=A0A8C6U4B2_9GOBI